MNDVATQMMSFMKALEKDPKDVATRRIFADFLSENGYDDEAEYQRNWSLEKYEAEEYLKDFAEHYDNGKHHWEEMLAGLVAGEYCFGDDDGPYMVRDNESLWNAVRTLTGKDLPPEHFNEGSFHCAC